MRCWFFRNGFMSGLKWMSSCYWRVVGGKFSEDIVLSLFCNKNEESAIKN